MSRACWSDIALLFGILAPFAAGQIHPYIGLETSVPFTNSLLPATDSSVIVAGAGSATSFYQYNSRTKPVVMGPTFRLEFVRGLGLEVDALYERLDYDVTTRSAGPNIYNQSFQQSTANRWQFPLLMQYNFLIGRGVFFVEAGPNLALVEGLRGSITTGMASPQARTVSTFTWSPGAWAGYTGGGGIDLAWKQFHMRPEFRYTRWFAQPGESLGSPTPATTIPAAPQGTHIDRNAASFVLGLQFGLQAE